MQKHPWLQKQSTDALERHRKEEEIENEWAWTECWPTKYHVQPKDTQATFLSS